MTVRQNFTPHEQGNDLYAIAVRERLSARRGNQIVIEFAGRVVFQGALPPGRGQIRPLSEHAAEVAYDTMVNAEVQRLLFIDDELAPMNSSLEKP